MKPPALAVRSHPHRAGLRVVVLALAVLGSAMGGEQDGRSGPPLKAPSAAEYVHGARAPEGVSIRDSLARVVTERNEVRSELDGLWSERWLLIGYSVLTSLLVLWFGKLLLAHGGPARIPARRQGEAEPTTDRVNARPVGRNATITIRDARTQQAQVIGRIETRRLFRRSETKGARLAGAAGGRPTTPVPVSAPVRATAAELQPTTDRLAKAPAKTPVQGAPAQRDPGPRVAVTGEAPFGKLGLFRREAFSLLEVMMAVAMLGIVLASVAGSIFSLGLTERLTKDEATVHELTRILAERIEGAQWDWLGRERTSDVDGKEYGGWSWQRVEPRAGVPAGLHPPLREGAAAFADDLSAQLFNHQKTAVKQLEVYLEYYSPDALDLGQAAVSAVGPVNAWAAARNGRLLTEPIDLRGRYDPVLVRIAARWVAQDGGPRRYEILVAKAK